MPTEQILTKHPMGKSGRRITRTRYDAVRQAIVAALSDAELTHIELMEALGRSLRGSFDGNVSWYGETVKLDLEARKVIERTRTTPTKYRIRPQGRGKGAHTSPRV